MIVQAMGTINWSDDDDKYLRDNYKQMTDEELAQALDKPANSVKNRIRALLLHRGDWPGDHDREIRDMAAKGYNTRQIAKSLGFSPERMRSYCKRNSIRVNDGRYSGNSIRQ